ncbi:vacuolar protein sorting-associated protein 53 A [Pelomyxa schiedti]|nr:vacuolar protein sorting-associated protein 53 A [Pelomyxa schiedti]
MDLYVSQEDKNIAKFISNSLSEEKWTVEEENDQKVLNSSTDIVYYLRTSMKRCMELSDGQPLFELNGVFKRHIRSYASALSAKIPPENGRLTAREIELCGIIVNTAEYLRLRTEQMGALWRRRISFKFKEKVDMSAEQNELKANCISKGVRTLSTLLNCKLEPFLVDMTKQPWATMADTQTDQSTYVTNIMTTLASDAPEIVKWLVNHYGFFCDLFVGSFCPELINCIFKCKRISENGAQSLLLDMAAIRTALLQLPNVTATPVNPFGDAQPERKEKKANNRFIKFVNGQMSKAELILKVAGAPQETCIETYLALVQAPSDEEFQKIIELKGLKGPDRQYLVDKFNRAADQARLTAATSTTSASSTATPANTSRQPQAAPTSGSITLPSLIGPSSASTAAAAAASSAATAASSAAAATSQGAQAAIRTMTGLFDRMRANLGNAED